MRFRNRAKRRRRRGSHTAAPTQQTPPNLITEIEQSVEARDRLETAVARFDGQRKQFKLALLGSLAAGLQVAEIDPNLLRDRLAAWKIEEARATEQLEALQQFLAMFKERVEGFKTAAISEVSGAIQNIITRLLNERDKRSADQNAINARIAKLSDELKTLQPKLPPTPPREPGPGERQGPPERKSKGIPSRDAAAKK